MHNIKNKAQKNSIKVFRIMIKKTPFEFFLILSAKNF